MKLLFNSDNFMERAKELLQEGIDLKREQALQNSKHPRLRRLAYSVLDFCLDKGISHENTYWIEQKNNQAKAVLSRLREAGIQESDLHTRDPYKRKTIRDVISAYLEDLKNF
jgi:hypothetical protein